jgi:serine/threonine protein kinase
LEYPNIDIHRKIHIISEATRCIDCLHQNNIIHLDVKPSNFLVNEDGSVVKICDFGVSKLKLTDNSSFDSEKVFDEASQKMICNIGTLGYQAPELYQNGEFGPKCDIYSLGILIYEIIFETPRHDFEVLKDPYFRTNVRFKGLRPNLEPYETTQDEKMKKLIELMNECWDLNKNKRPDAKEIITRLEKLKNL